MYQMNRVRVAVEFDGDELIENQAISRNALIQIWPAEGKVD